MIDPDLANYAQTRSPEAFRVLVDRYVHLVHAQAMRQLGDHHMAEDVTQAVFVVLSRKAPTLRPDIVLPAWLFKATRYACSVARRTESRRRHHEHEAAMQRTNLDQPDPITNSDLSPLLDDALARLGKLDRTVLILRYYTGLTAPQVAQQLGLTAEAARRRISRAVIKLRQKLPGISESLSPAIFAASLESLSTHLAPHTLVQSVAAQAAGPSTVTCTTIANGVIHKMRWTAIKISMAAMTTVFTLAIGGVALNSALGQHSPLALAAPAQTNTNTATIDPATADLAPDSQAIKSTLTLIAQAIRSSDTKTLDQCVSVTNDDNGALLKAMLLDNMGTRHLQDAWAAKFNNPMTIPNLSFIWFPAYDGGMEVLFEKTLANLDPSEIQITGATARLPFKFAARNPDADQTGGWAGAWIIFTKEGPTWKLDLAKTMYVRLWLYFAPGKQPHSSQQEWQIATATKLDIAKMLQDTAAQIDSGKLATPQAASRKIQSEARKLFARHNLNGVNYNPLPAGPISTE